MEWIWVWVAVVSLSLLIEFVTMEMVSIWTTVGGLVALILSALNVNLEIQLIVFFLVTIIMLLSLRKFALKHLLKNNELRIGTSSIIGTTHKLKTAITEDERGTIKINDITWSVTTENGTQLPAETIVEIVKIEGNKLIVKEKENK